MDDKSIPEGWDPTAHNAWSMNRKLDAVQAVLDVLNQYGPKKPLTLGMQLTYYLYRLQDYPSSVQMLEVLAADYPDASEILLNLGVCLTRCQKFTEAITKINAFCERQPDNPSSYDVLAEAYHGSGDLEAAKAAGTRALTLKNAQAPSCASPLEWPTQSPAAYLAQGKKINVIAFSLWGDNPRYLRGAIDNALQRASIYPDWQLRFYVDATVPQEIIRTLNTLGADIILEAPDQPIGQRLCWRFDVANDERVGRFLVRDVDSVINPREASAVKTWMASPQWFHVMRDWWTHTDLMLAGMWGGVAGLLPNLRDLLTQAKLTGFTGHIDQGFLRDAVWPLIREHCLVHDRCFSPPGAQPWGLPDPEGNRHVGQCIFTAYRAQQEARLKKWIKKLPSLQLTA